MLISKVQFGQAVTNPFKTDRIQNNFVKNTFNFENANLTHPACKVSNSPLGDPDKAAVLDLLG